MVKCAWDTLTSVPAQPNRLDAADGQADSAIARQFETNRKTVTL